MPELVAGVVTGASGRQILAQTADAGEMSRTTYRRDIDGLRAIAVVPVILYHLKENTFQGGYVGVDVFFVISGYLITQILQTDLDRGQYSIVRFYERRARRIFPAFFATCIAASILMLWWKLPFEVADYSASLASATFFVSNIYFYLTSDYFAAAAESKPLLHTWSLAVEEQFYILFPLILWAIFRFSARIRIYALAALLAVSFAVSIYLVKTNETAAFYLIPSRAWELLVGSLLVYLPPLRDARKRPAEILGMVGLGAILVSVFSYSVTTPFPGIAAALPCVGTALVIFAGQRHTTLIARLLSIRPMVWIGKISYSLYLWHWLFCFAVFSFWDPITRPIKAAAIAATFALAWTSWRFVEQPFRTAATFTRSKILTMTGAGMGALLIMAVTLGPISDHLWVIPEEASRLLALDETPRAPSGKGCFLTTLNDGMEWFDTDHCLPFSENKSNLLLLGDSMAADLSGALKDVYPEFNVLQATASGCKPVIEAQGAKRCTNLMNEMFKEFVPAHHVTVVVLSARWLEKDIDDVAATIAYLKKFVDAVVISGPRVEYRSALPRLLAMGIITKNPNLVTEARIPGKDRLDQLFADRVKASSGFYFSAYKAVCPPDGCLTQVEAGVPMEFDYGHFTPEGARYVMTVMRHTVDLPNVKPTP